MLVMEESGPLNSETRENVEREEKWKELEILRKYESRRVFIERGGRILFSSRQCFRQARLFGGVAALLCFAFVCVVSFTQSFGGNLSSF